MSGKITQNKLRDEKNKLYINKNKIDELNKYNFYIKTSQLCGVKRLRI